MQHYAATQNVTFHQIALAAVALALQNDDVDTDIVVGAPFLGRKCQSDLETVGLFLEPLPIRIKFPVHGAQAGIEEPQPASFIHAV